MVKRKREIFGNGIKMPSCPHVIEILEMQQLLLISVCRIVHVHALLITFPPIDIYFLVLFYAPRTWWLESSASAQDKSAAPVLAIVPCQVSHFLVPRRFQRP